MDWESHILLWHKSGPERYIFCILRLAEILFMVEEAFRNLKEALLRGERLALSKSITLVETSNQDLFPFRDRLLDLVQKLPPADSFRLAVTGVPGAGKSTLINALGVQWVRQGHKVAVLAVDPSSEVSLGSVLGDKTRMAELAREEAAFIRPSPTRLHLGGVASSTYESILLCEAAGYDRILVETVGVGQSELEVSQLTDACLLLLVAGAGDDLQALKRGVLEAADFIMISKADGENRARAAAAARDLQQVSSLWTPRPAGNRTQVFSASSMESGGMEGWMTLPDEFLKASRESGYFAHNRQEQGKKWFRSILWNRMEEELRSRKDLIRLLDEMESARQLNASFLEITGEFRRRLKIEVKSGH